MEICKKCGATMIPQSADKYVCEFCGNTVIITIEKSDVENTPQQPITQREVDTNANTEKQEENLGCWMWGLCFIIPLIGLIMFFVYRSQRHKAKAQSAITAAIIGFVISIILEISGFWDGFWEGFFGGYYDYDY
jgi:uncharacterized membrane protein YvbJ